MGGARIHHILFLTSFLFPVPREPLSSLVAGDIPESLFSQNSRASAHMRNNNILHSYSLEGSILRNRNVFSFHI